MVAPLIVTDADLVAAAAADAGVYMGCGRDVASKGRIEV
jgi:hypothetical protein